MGLKSQNHFPMRNILFPQPAKLYPLPKLCKHLLPSSLWVPVSHLCQCVRLWAPIRGKSERDNPVKTKAWRDTVKRKRKTPKFYVCLCTRVCEKTHPHWPDYILTAGMPPCSPEHIQMSSFGVTLDIRKSFLSAGQGKRSCLAKRIQLTPYHVSGLEDS